jgi:hypothetical protein
VLIERRILDAVLQMHGLGLACTDDLSKAIWRAIAAADSALSKPEAQ